MAPSEAPGSVAEVKDALGRVGYLADEPAALVSYLAQSSASRSSSRARPGSARPSSRRRSRRATGRELIRLQCYEGLDEAKALYEWNYRKQLLRIQAERGARGRPRPEPAAGPRMSPG